MCPPPDQVRLGPLCATSRNSTCSTRQISEGPFAFRKSHTNRNSAVPACVCALPLNNNCLTNFNKSLLVLELMFAFGNDWSYVKLHVFEHPEFVCLHDSLSTSLPSSLPPPSHLPSLPSSPPLPLPHPPLPFFPTSTPR